MANTTQYQELVDIFFNKIKDYDFANMDENIAAEILAILILPVVSFNHVHRIWATGMTS